MKELVFKSTQSGKDWNTSWSDEILFEADAEPTEVLINEDEEGSDADAGTPATSEDENPEGQPEGDVEAKPEGDKEPDEEPATEAEPAESTALTDAQVVAYLKENKVNTLVAERLATQGFATEDAVKEAVAAELQYLKAATNSGKPFGMQESASPAAETISMTERDERLDKINSRHLGTTIPGKTE